MALFLIEWCLLTLYNKAITDTTLKVVTFMSGVTWFATKIKPTLPEKIGLAVSLGFLLCYIFVFMLTNRIGFLDAFIAAVINTVSLLFWGILSVHLIKKHILPLRFYQQIPAHFFLAIVFSIVWYFTIIVLLGFKNGNITQVISVHPFSTAAFKWQFFQGATIYLGLCSASVAWQQWSEQQDKAPVMNQAPGKLLIRDSDNIFTISIDDIICISGAGDYSEIVTQHKKYLTRRRINDLEAQLSACFVRVHRSHLVNLDKMQRAESIGNGRLRVYLASNIVIDTSRQGARLLRQQAC